MRVVWCLLLIHGVAMGATKSTAQDVRLGKFLQKEWEWAMGESPESATAVGFPGYDDKWSDLSRDSIERRKRHAHEALKKLRAIGKTGLSPSSKLNYELYENDLRLDIAGEKFPGEWLILSQMGGIPQHVAETLSAMPADKAEHFENLISRLEKAPVLIRQHQRLLAEGAVAGVTPPKITLRDIDAQIAAQLEPDPDKNPMLIPFGKIPPDVPKAKAAALREKAARIVKEKVIPAYKELRAFFNDDYLPKARETTGFSSLPNGAAWYAYLVERNTTLNLAPERIHQIGLEEVKRIRGEMEAVKAEAKFDGPLEAFFDFLRTDSRFYFTKPEELLVAYRDISKRADHELPRLFGRLPRLSYGVMPIPSYAERSAPTAYYRPGSLVAGRAGAYFANTYDLHARPKWEMEALSLHEAVPGHHLQISLAQEEESLPEFRKFAGYTAYVEGWGLYAEGLGEAMGFYKDPYSKMGRLIYEMWRAVRLVVDTGLHALGWSRDRAIHYFVENTGKASHDIEVEVDRYMVMPGQALAYKLGELKLKELREKARARLRAKFDVRRFHDALLGEGALPLGVLERRIDHWMDSQR